jgi:hypothetical protein
MFRLDGKTCKTEWPWIQHAWLRAADGVGCHRDRGLQWRETRRPSRNRSHRQGIVNFTEGLRPWQPKKLYYFSDASHADFLEGKGPRYPTTETSPLRGIPSYRLAADEMSFHLTQDDTGQVARQAIAKGIGPDPSIARNSERPPIFARRCKRPIARGPCAPV